MDRCYLERRWGGSIERPSVDDMKACLAELDKRDPEHPDTWLTHESGWTLSYDENRVLVWENIEDDLPSPRHLRDVSQDRVLEIWSLLAGGDFASIEAQAWIDGYGR